jgi:hypothetical protein
MKELIELLEERGLWNYGDAKPCKIYINQAYREGVVVVGDKNSYHVAYKMPNGRMYAKNVDEDTASRILNIEMKLSVKEDGTTLSAFGF